MRCVILTAFVSSLAISIPAAAEIADVASSGFTVQVSTHIQAATDRIFAVLIHPSRWWSADHTFSRDAANLTLDARAGGCFCEKLPNGGAVAHLTVVYIDPGKLLRMRGALGPFQGLGVDGAMTWLLKAAGDGTDLSLTYALGGYRKDGFEQWSKAADGMLTEQVARLKRAVETGAPGER
jgi:uncharacterized protein YndB with AHSA1/START domain